MKSLYLRLAAGNIKNNRRFYLPFLLTAVMTVACFFILSSVGLSQTRCGVLRAVRRPGSRVCDRAV